MKLTLTRCIAISALAAAPCFGMAQATKWAVEPSYDGMALYPGASIVAATSGGKVSFYSMDGNKMFEAAGSAVADSAGNVFITNGGKVVGFVNASGKSVDVNPPVKAVGAPAFVDGLLMYADGNGYGTIDTDGNRHDMPAGVVRAFPYSHGYAMYQAYENPDKKKGLHYGYSSLGAGVDYSAEGKEVKPDEVKFLSSVAPDGRGVAVFGDKLYWFDSATGKFEPMLIEEQQPVLNEGTVAALADFGTEIYTFRGSLGERQKVTFCFTKDLAPEKIVYSGMTMEFDAPAPASASASAAVASRPAGNFSVEKSDSAGFVLRYKGAVVPSSAFEAVGDVYGDYAIVKAGGKWGILTCMPKIELDFTLLGANDSESIAFRHAKTKGTLIVDVPAGVDAASVEIAVPDSLGALMAINKFGREQRTAGGVTRITYPVTLGIPPTITDMLTEISYPVDVMVDGVKQYGTEVKADGWYVKNYMMDFNPDHAPALDSNGNVQFVVDIIKDQPDACDYPLSVGLVSDVAMSPIVWNVNKLTETKYQFTLSNLMPGSNRFWVVMSEEGCPTYTLPFEIENTSTAPQQRMPQQYSGQYVAAQPVPQQYQQPVQQQYQQPVQQQYQQPVQQQYQQPVQQQYQQPVQQQYQQPVQQQYQQPVQQQYQQPVQQLQAQQSQVFKL